MKYKQKAPLSFHAELIYVSCLIIDPLALMTVPKRHKGQRKKMSPTDPCSIQVTDQFTDPASSSWAVSFQAIWFNFGLQKTAWWIPKQIPWTRAYPFWWHCKWVSYVAEAIWTMHAEMKTWSHWISSIIHLTNVFQTNTGFFASNREK